MISKLFAIVCTGVLLVGWTASGLAQCNMQAETDRALATIDRVREVVTRSDLREARELLRAAETRLGESRERARRGDRELACRLARVSAGLAEKAGEVARRGIRGLEELEQMLQRTDQNLSETGALVRESDSVEADRFLRAGMRHQKAAWNAFRGRRPKFAVKFTLMAREAASRARQAAEGDAPGNRPFVQRQLQRTDRLLDEAARVLGERSEGDPEALVPARRLQHAAGNQLHQGHPGLALGLTRQARAVIRRALGDAVPEPAPEDVAALLGTTQELLDRLRPEAAEQDQAKRLLPRADTLLDDARRALEDGDLRRALGSARAASALALDISELLDRDGGDE